MKWTVSVESASREPSSAFTPEGRRFLNLLHIYGAAVAIYRSGWCVHMEIEEDCAANAFAAIHHLVLTSAQTAGLPRSRIVRALIIDPHFQAITTSDRPNNHQEQPPSRD